MRSTHTAEYNPLFAKMQARFCVGGTLAEKMEKQAAAYRKDQKTQTFSDYLARIDTTAECKEKRQRKHFSLKLSLRSASTACMALLIGGTLLFSGATLGSMLADEDGGVNVFVSEIAPQSPILDGGAVTEEVPETLVSPEV